MPEPVDYTLTAEIKLDFPYGPGDVIHDSWSGWTFKILDVFSAHVNATVISSDPKKNQISSSGEGRATAVIVDAPDKEIIGHQRTMRFSRIPGNNSGDWTVIELGERPEQ